MERVSEVALNDRTKADKRTKGFGFAFSSFCVCVDDVEVCS